MPAPRFFQAITTTGVATVAAIPTTAAHFVVQNGEPVGGKTYTITSLGGTFTTTAGATMIVQLLALVLPGSWPIISGTAAKGPFAVDGLPNSLPAGGSRAAVASAVTLTAGQAASGAWHPVGTAFNTAALTATIAAGVWANVKGLYRLAPGGLIALATLGSTAAGAVQLSVTWEEEQL